MTREAIVQLFAHRQALYNDFDSAALAAGHADDCVLESPFAGRSVGRAAIEQVYRSLFVSFPDFTFEATDLIIDGDRAVQLAVISGTDTGGFMGLPPTGKPFQLPAVFVFTLSDGLIGHMKAVYDFTGWLVQIGNLKAKPA
jgi:steroid delta-isomerase-like uncharacterized protein